MRTPRPLGKRAPGFYKIGGKKPLGKIFAGIAKKAIQKEQSKLYWKDKVSQEKARESMEKTKNQVDLKIYGFKLKAKNLREQQEIFYDLQNGLIPERFLKLSKIRELLKNPANYQKLFNLLYSYYTGEINPQQTARLIRILKKAITGGTSTDIQEARFRQLRETRNKEIQETQERMQYWAQQFQG